MTLFSTMKNDRFGKLVILNSEAIKSDDFDGSVPIDYSDIFYVQS